MYHFSHLKKSNVFFFKNDPGMLFGGRIPVAFFSQALEAERAAAAETAEVQPL